LRSPWGLCFDFQPSSLAALLFLSRTLRLFDVWICFYGTERGLCWTQKQILELCPAEFKGSDPRMIEGLPSRRCSGSALRMLTMSPECRSQIKLPPIFNVSTLFYAGRRKCATRRTQIFKSQKELIFMNLRKIKERPTFEIKKGTWLRKRFLSSRFLRHLSPTLSCRSLKCFSKKGGTHFA